MKFLQCLFLLSAMMFGSGNSFLCGAAPKISTHYDALRSNVQMGFEWSKGSPDLSGEYERRAFGTCCGICGSVRADVSEGDLSKIWSFVLCRVMDGKGTMPSQSLLDKYPVGAGPQCIQGKCGRPSDDEKVSGGDSPMPCDEEKS